MAIAPRAPKAGHFLAPELSDQENLLAIKAGLGLKPQQAALRKVYAVLASDPGVAYHVGRIEDESGLRPAAPLNTLVGLGSLPTWPRIAPRIVRVKKGRYMAVEPAPEPEAEPQPEAQTFPFAGRTLVSHAAILRGSYVYAPGDDDSDRWFAGFDECGIPRWLASLHDAAIMPSWVLEQVGAIAEAIGALSGYEVIPAKPDSPYRSVVA